MLKRFLGKRRMKVLAVFSAIALLLSCIPISLAGASSADSNIIMNQTFEGVTDLAAEGWSVGTQYAIATDVGHGDSKSLKRNPGNAWGRWGEYKFATEANTDYEFSFWVNTSQGFLLQLVKMANDSDAGVLKEFRDDTLNTNGEWQQFTLSFNSGSTVQYKINICTGVNTTEPTYYDDFLLTTKTVNQTFEGVTDLAAEGWSVGTANQYAIATDVAHSGSQSLKRNPGGAWGRWGEYKFAAKANTDYEFSFWVNTSQGFLLQLVKMANDSDAGVLKEFRDDTLNTNGEWKQYKLSFNSGSTVQYKINICTGVTTTEPTYYDDFLLTTKTMEQTFGDVTDLAAEGWSVGTQYAIATDVAHSGSQSLKRNPGNAWGRWGEYKFATEANTDYEFSFWVNTSQGFLLQLVKMANDSDAGVLKEFRDDTLNTNGEWKQYTLSFNSGSTVQYKIGICTGVNTTEPTYYDDFVLKVKTEEEDEGDEVSAVVNQTFEGVTDLAAEGWSVGTANQYGIATDVAHGGSQSLVRNPGNAWGRWGEYKFAAEANTDYEFSFWVNTSQGFLVQLIKMANDCDAGVVKEFRDDALNTNGEWKQYTLSFNSGSTVQYKIGICTGVNTTEPTYYDDFVLKVKTEEEDEGDPNTVLQETFETELDTGKWYGGLTKYSIVTDTAHGGTHSFKRDPSGAWGAWAFCKFDVKENTEYKLTFWVNTAEGYHVEVETPDEKYTPVILDDPEASTDGEWAKVTAVFNSGANTTMQISICTSAKTTTDTYYDDITVKVNGTGDDEDDDDEGSGFKKNGWIISKTDANATCDPEDNLISNPGCDNVAYWSDAEGYGEILTVTDAGTLRVSGQGTYTKLFTVEAGVDYCLTYDGIADLSTLADVVFQIVNSNGVVFKVKEERYGYFFNEHRIPGQDGFWHSSTIFFNSGDLTTVGLRLVATKGAIELDNIRLYKLDDRKTVSTSGTAAKATLTNHSKFGCADEDNIFPSFAEVLKDEAWTKAEGWNEFVTVDTYAGSDVLHYKGYKQNDLHYYYVPIAVEPNTDYVFSMYYKVLETGKATFGLTNDKDYQYAALDVQWELQDKTADDLWGLYTVCFNSGDADSICLAIWDEGGEALFAKPRLFTMEDSVELTDADMPAVEQPKTDDDADDNDADDNDADNGNTNNGESDSDNASPETGSELPVMAVILLLVSAVVMALTAVRRKRGCQNG